MIFSLILNMKFIQPWMLFLFTVSKLSICETSKGGCPYHASLELNYKTSVILYLNYFDGSGYVIWFCYLGILMEVESGYNCNSKWTLISLDSMWLQCQDLYSIVCTFRILISSTKKVQISNICLFAYNFR